MQSRQSSGGPCARPAADAPARWRAAGPLCPDARGSYTHGRAYDGQTAAEAAGSGDLGGQCPRDQPSFDPESGIIYVELFMNSSKPERSMTTTRLYLVRHGATPLSAEDRFSGDVGVELSAEGRSQVERLAERVRDDAISAIYCSPLSRAVETARIIAGGCGLELTMSDGLREIRRGHWEGLTR